ncbi:MAG: beta-phosphoglucomutase [Oscillospiraceae bacterium]|jgi:beta-phosphoglucomutase|nr:beta-phosphoglucomutase [Oscillospiraceae bacterium]
MTKNTLKAVIFDLDGVITDSAEFHYLAWKGLADRLGIYFDRKINERLKGVPRMNSLEIILEKDNVPNRYSVEEKQILADEKNSEYVKLINTITPGDILPGILDLLNNLKKHEIKTAIASASKNAPTIIERLGIGHLFDYIADAEAVKQQKPAPDIFLSAADGVSTCPSRCVGVEDAKAGIQSIKAAKMVAIGIGEEKYLKGADLILPGTADLTLKKIEDAYNTFR